MLKQFFPYEQVKSVFHIDYEALYQKGYRGIIFDIDGTLVPHGDGSTPQVDELFRHIHSVGLKTLLLSNNNTQRIEQFIQNIDTPYIPDADKPDPKNYQKAVSMLDFNLDEVVFVGDQIFTDIRGANRCGMASILVEFLTYPGESRFSKRRMVEQCILAYYKMQKSQTHRLGNISLQRSIIDNEKEKTVL